MHSRAPRTAREPAFVAKAGSVSIPVYHRVRSVAGRSYNEFAISFYDADGTRVRRWFADMEEARREAARIAANLSKGQLAPAYFTAGDAAVYGAAMDALKPLGVDLLAAVNEFVQARNVLPPGAVLVEAAREFSRRHPANVPRRTVAEVVDELAEDRVSAACSPEHVRDLTKRLGPFARAFQCPIQNATGALVREYLAQLQSVSGRKLTNRSRDNARRLIVSLFNFARQQGYISRELADEIGELPRPRLEPVKTGVFTPSAMRILLDAADEELRGAVAIGGFAGLRTAEIHRLDWKDVKLAERVIIVGAEKAKTASRRVVPVTENLAEWLAPLVRESRPVVHHSHEHQLAWDFCKLARRAGVEWVRNGLRHSFCSYRLAVTGNAPQTAYEAGNSVAMVDRHYRALVTSADGAAWFALRPTTVNVQ